MPDHVHFVLHLESNVEKPTTLGKVIGAYKSLAAVAWLRHIQSLGADGITMAGQIWQRDYIDRIIHTTHELERVRTYIRNNPIKLQASLEQNK